MGIQNMIINVIVVSIIIVLMFLLLGVLIEGIGRRYDKKDKERGNNNNKDYEDGHYDGDWS